MMYGCLAERDRKRRACCNDRPIRGGIEPRAPDIGALDLGAEEMHHRRDELTALEFITAVRPDGFFNRFFGFGILFRLRGFDWHIDDSFWMKKRFRIQLKLILFREIFLSL